MGGNFCGWGTSCRWSRLFLRVPQIRGKGRYATSHDAAHAARRFLFLPRLFSRCRGSLGAEPPVINFGGADRFLTYVSTTSRFTGLVRSCTCTALLNARTRVPGTDAASGGGGQVTGPKGDVVAQGGVSPQDGVFGFSWDIPAATAGGEYT